MICCAGLLTQAEKVLLQGIECLEAEEEESALNQSRLDKMKANLARIYTAMDRYDDATNLYASLQESELSSVFGIALAHFKAGRHEESFFTYNAAQDWLTGDDEKLSHLKVGIHSSISKNTVSLWWATLAYFKISEYSGFDLNRW